MFYGYKPSKMALSYQQVRGYWGFGGGSPERGVYDLPKNPVICNLNLNSKKKLKKNMAESGSI